MTGHLIILGKPDVAEKAIGWIKKAPKGTRVTFQGPRRSLDQNSRFWSMLSDFAEQVEHHGMKYPAETWKAIFMHALGEEMKFVPSLDGKTVVPIGNRSSKLSVQQMCDLQELITSEGAARGVKFRVFEHYQG